MTEIIIDGRKIKTTEKVIKTLEDLKSTSWRLNDEINYHGSENSWNPTWTKNKYIYLHDQLEAVKNAIKYMEDDLLDKNPKVTL